MVAYCIGLRGSIACLFWQEHEHTELTKITKPYVALRYPQDPQREHLCVDELLIFDGMLQDRDAVPQPK